MTNSIILKDGILDLSSATKFEDFATNGCITIIRSTSGDRTKLSKELLKSIGNPKAVDVYFTDEQVIVVPAPEGSGGAVKIGKNEIIYNTQLAEKIMAVAGVNFQKNKSTKTGTFTVEKVDETTSAAVISFNSSTAQTADAVTEKEATNED